VSDIVAWDGEGKILYIKKNCNQSTTGGFGAKEFLIVLDTKQILYLYGTTLSTDAEEWPGV
jgi:hypothetical protein